VTTRRRFRPPVFRPPATRNRLLVVLRDRRGVLGHVALGSALLDADSGGELSMLPSGDEAAALAEFFCDTPTQAERAMDELAELGDVPFHPRDFAPRWFFPRRGRAAVDWLLARRDDRKARRVLTERCAPNSSNSSVFSTTPADPGIGSTSSRRSPERMWPSRDLRWGEGRRTTRCSGRSPRRPGTAGFAADLGVRRTCGRGRCY
jgi:hypothetical protein